MPSGVHSAHVRTLDGYHGHGTPTAGRLALTIPLHGRGRESIVRRYGTVARSRALAIGIYFYCGAICYINTPTTLFVRLCYNR